VNKFPLTDRVHGFRRVQKGVDRMPPTEPGAASLLQLLNGMYTHQSKVVEQKRYLRPWIQESLLTLRRIAFTSRFTDNGLVISVSMNTSNLGQNNRT
jgi:hypothetical protein